MVGMQLGVWQRGAPVQLQKEEEEVLAGALQFGFTRAEGKWSQGYRDARESGKHISVAGMEAAGR